MAARENQGYLIAVIILVVLALFLALLTFLGFSKMAEHSDNSRQMENELRVEKKLNEALQIEVDVLKAYLGGLGPSLAEVETQISSIDRLASDSQLDANQKAAIADVKARVNIVKGEYEKDMKMFISPAGEQQAQDRTYRALVNNFATVLGKQYNELQVRNNEVTRIQNEANTEITAKQKTLEETIKAKDTALAELAEEKKRNSEKEVELNNALADARKANDEVNSQLDNKTKEFGQKEKDLLQEVAKLKTDNENLTTRINEVTRESFDLPDGNVVLVSPGYKRVHLDLGSADGVRSGYSFAIFDKDVTSFQKDQHKASVEVLEVVGPHQSVARVTQDNVKNPILRGDYAVSPTWDPGYSTPIALVGFFDLDYDGRNDRERLVQMIERNGGRVVAQHDDEGNIIGAIDSSTRYLVMGESPEGAAEVNPAVFTAIKSLMDQGKVHYVQEIDMRKMLNWMGRHGQEKIERSDSRMGQPFLKRQPVDSLKSSDR
jgi:regulatory protein YycI of two-component signal transduction system YycFG